MERRTGELLETAPVSWRQLQQFPLRAGGEGSRTDEQAISVVISIGTQQQLVQWNDGGTAPKGTAGSWSFLFQDVRRRVMQQAWQLSAVIRKQRGINTEIGKYKAWTLTGPKQRGRESWNNTGTTKRLYTVVQKVSARRVFSFTRIGIRLETNVRNSSQAIAGTPCGRLCSFRTRRG
jgi:hypothetical protein